MQKVIVNHIVKTSSNKKVEETAGKQVSMKSAIEHCAPNIRYSWFISAGGSKFGDSRQN